MVARVKPTAEASRGPSAIRARTRPLSLPHKFTHADIPNAIAPPLRNVFLGVATNCHLPAPARSSPPSKPRKQVGLFVSGVDEAKKSESERNCFAERNEVVRIAGRKSLKSLSAANHDFAGSFVFNGLSAISFRGFLACGSSVSETLWFSAGERPIRRAAMCEMSEAPSFVRVSGRSGAWLLPFLKS
jgi:hypothetical protein